MGDSIGLGLSIVKKNLRSECRHQYSVFIPIRGTSFYLCFQAKKGDRANYRLF